MRVVRLKEKKPFFYIAPFLTPPPALLDIINVF